MDKNTEIFRKAVKELEKKWIYKQAIAKEMGIESLQFNRYYMGTRVPDADLVDGIILRYGLDIELVGGEVKVEEKPVTKEEPIIKEEPVILPKQEEVPVKEEKTIEEPKSVVFNINDFLKKFNSLSDYNKKTIIDMVDSLLYIQKKDQTNKPSSEVKPDVLGLKLKK